MNAYRFRPLFVCLVLLAGSCGGEVESPAPGPETPTRPVARPYRVVHVFVALCDNKHQKIVPVPATLGNGQDPRNNLYWGALYGTDTFFRKSTHWKHVETVEAPEVPGVIARSAFVSVGGGEPVYVVMSAYDGRRMTEALTDFLGACAGTVARQVTLLVEGKRVSVSAGGGADLVCFVGHNGLMDGKVDPLPEGAPGGAPRTAVVLACRSQSYFAEPLRKARCRPLLTTSGLLAPEAYTLDAVIRSWSADDNPATTHEKAAQAYAKYQKCSPAAARRIFVCPTPP